MLMLTSPELVRIYIYMYMVRLVELYGNHFHSVSLQANSVPLFSCQAISHELSVQGEWLESFRWVGTGLVALLVGIEFLEPKLRCMRSTEYWRYNMSEFGPMCMPRRLRGKIRKTESCSMYMMNHDIRLHSAGRDTYELD